MSTDNSALLGQLGRHRWAVPLIAALAERKGARFVELLALLSTNRESLTRTLGGAAQNGWVMRNPGHGHPLRPEYILTEAGWAIAPLCTGIEGVRKAVGLAPASLSRWSLPVIRCIDQGTHRFAGIERGISDSNPRALTQSLKSLVGQQLVTRTVLDDYPPAPEYWLSQSGSRMAAVLAGA